MVLLIGLTLSLLLTVINGQNEPDPCQESIVIKCSDFLLSTRWDIDQLVVSRETIENTCERVDDAKKCIEEYVDNCQSTKTKEDYIEEGGEILLNTCDFFRKDYLPHLECYSKLADTYNRCMSDIKNIVSDEYQMLHISNGTSTQAEKQSFCCGIDKVSECVNYPTFHKCGEEAAKTMKIFLRRQIPPPLLVVCDTVKCEETVTETYVPTTKNPNSSSQLTSIVALVLSLNLISFLS